MSGKKASEKSPRIPVLASTMRQDASMTDDPDITKPRPCKCGCGRIFIPTTKHHKFIGDHRKQAWVKRNAGPIAISKIRKDHADILARLERLEKHFGIKERPR